jgi:hypothetical protein
MATTLEILASVLSFSGGAVLSVDALLAYRNARSQRGGEKLAEAAARAEKPVSIEIEGGQRLHSGSDVAVDRSALARGRTVAGFSLAAAGFGLDLIFKLFCA